MNKGTHPAKEISASLRDMWETRPLRPQEGRQLAGVAAAIARRYDIDVTLVRVAFVVFAFMGVGGGLYLAGWLLLRNAPENPAVRRSPVRWWAVVGFILSLLGLVDSIFGEEGPPFILMVLLAVGLLYLTHRYRGDLVRAQNPPGMTGPVAMSAGEAGTTAEPATGVPAGQEGQQPPAWDPLGAAPFAWDLPEPSQPAPPPAPRRPPVTLVTLGAALLAGGATLGILLLAPSMGPESLPVLLGVVLTVLGLGLVAGSFLRAGRGIIPFAVVLSMITWGVLAAPLSQWQGNGVGDLRAAPTTPAQLQTHYERTAGDIELDLSRLDLTVQPDGDTSPVHTMVSLGAGDIQVVLPRDADVTFTGQVNAGEIRFEDRVEEGFGDTRMAVVDDLGADGVRSGRPLVLNVDAGASGVEVRRG